MVNLHFEITPSGRVKFRWQENDTRLEFDPSKKGRKASTIESIGLAFIQIAEKAKKLNQYK